MSEVPVTTDLLQRLNVDNSIPLPDPSNVPQMDLPRVEKWISEETDDKRRTAKVALVNGIEYISFNRFLGALEVATPKVREALGDKPYAVIYGDKPHASQRWVFSLMRNVLPEPALATYFKGNYTPTELKHLIWSNKNTHEDNIEPEVIPETTNTEKFNAALVEKDIETFLFVDDISYSARQMYENVRRLIYAFKQKNPNKKPRVVIFVPAATERLDDLLNEPKRHPYSDESKELKEAEIITIPPPIPLKNTEEVLSEAGLPNLGVFRLNATDERRFPMDACLSYADHKFPDHWSFPNQIATHTFPSRYKVSEEEMVPYKRPDTEYYQTESEEFTRYKEQFVDKAGSDLR